MERKKKLFEGIIHSAYARKNSYDNNIPGMEFYLLICFLVFVFSRQDFSV